MVLPFTLWSPGEEEVRVCVLWSWASENGHMLCTIMVVQFVRRHAQRVVVWCLRSGESDG